jgi:hypothetical protein
MKRKIIILLVITAFIVQHAGALCPVKQGMPKELSNELFLSKDLFLTRFIWSLIEFSVNAAGRDNRETKPLGGNLPVNKKDDSQGSETLYSFNQANTIGSISYFTSLIQHVLYNSKATLYGQNNPYFYMRFIWEFISLLIIMLFYLLPRGAIDGSFSSVKYRDFFRLAIC